MYSPYIRQPALECRVAACAMLAQACPAQPCKACTAEVIPCPAMLTISSCRGLA